MSRRAFNFRERRLIAILPLTTLIVPEVIAAQTWLMMLGNNGLITRSLGDWGIPLPSFYGWPGLITVMTFIYYTYIYMGTLAAIRGFDLQLEQAAQSLGTSPAMSRMKVMFPVVLPSILASALLVFTLVVGNFAVATILGHKVELLSVITYQTFVSEVGSDPVMQSTLASVSIALVALVLFIQRFVIARGRFEITLGRGAIPQPFARIFRHDYGGRCRACGDCFAAAAWSVSSPALSRGRAVRSCGGENGPRRIWSVC